MLEYPFQIRNSTGKVHFPAAPESPEFLFKGFAVLGFPPVC
jgi:hypothetical protein